MLLNCREKKGLCKSLGSIIFNLFTTISLKTTIFKILFSTIDSNMGSTILGFQNKRNVFKYSYQIGPKLEHFKI